jgi:predicted GNAT superfamily acetyltransferase
MSATVSIGSDARSAARAAGVEIRPPGSQREVRELSSVLARIWAVPDERSPGPVNVLTALRDTGGYVVGAWHGGHLLGGSFGLTYLDEGQPCLRSQVTGTVHAGVGIGLALKLHQRDWAARTGLVRITWTFDPLVRRNGRFNVHRLGARVVRYVPDFYGSLDDGMSGTGPTDRAVVSWPVAPVGGGTSARSVARPAVALLADLDGAPSLGAFEPDATVISIATPADVVALRTSAPELADRWAVAMREAMTAALAAGFVGVDVDDAGAYRFEGVDGEAGRPGG